MQVEIYDTDNYKSITEAQKDGATSIMDINFEHIETMHIVLEAVIELYGKKEIGIRQSEV